MARVLVPVMNRRYNANPRGSATTTVTMSSNHPFERQTRVMNSTRSMLPGMGALGVLGEDAPAPAAPAATIDWTKVLTGVAAAGTQVAQTAATNAVNQLIPPPTTKVPVANSMTILPVVNPNYVAPAPSKLPWILGGVGLLVVGVGAMFLFRKKR